VGKKGRLSGNELGKGVGVRSGKYRNANLNPSEGGSDQAQRVLTTAGKRKQQDTNVGEGGVGFRKISQFRTREVVKLM